MSSLEINYINYEDFARILFALVEEQFDYDPSDPLPDYRAENSEQLHTILTFIQNDEHYPALEEKSAYLFVSIVKNHIYSNGNKRLALITFLYFLIINGMMINCKIGELKEMAIYVADKDNNKAATFDELKVHVCKFISPRLYKHNY